MFLTQLVQRLANDPFDNMQLTFHPFKSCNCENIETSEDFEIATYVWKTVIQLLVMFGTICKIAKKIFAYMA